MDGSGDRRGRGNEEEVVVGLVCRTGQSSRGWWGGWLCEGAGTAGGVADAVGRQRQKCISDGYAEGGGCPSWCFCRSAIACLDH